MNRSDTCRQPNKFGFRRTLSIVIFSPFLTFSISVAVSILPALGRTITPAPENVIPQPMVTALTVTVGDVSLYRSRITLLPSVAHPPEDGVTAIPV
jgi:hypothetical protein